MYKIFLVCSNKIFYHNEAFRLDSPENRDNCAYPYYLLQLEMFKKGVILNTYDYLKKNSEKNYALLFFDFPKNINYFIKKHKNIDKFLIVYESPIKNPANQNIKNSGYFKKIFTWNNKLVDNKKYFKLNYAQKIEILNFNIKEKNKLCTAIFGHKSQTHPQELYSERIRAIRWFEKEHPHDFDLYGTGWDKYYFKDKLFHLNRLKFLTKILRPNYPSYKGEVVSKKETYKSYKFAICYENAQFPDYITEKIFDCFFGGCVPIYLGAPNIASYVPKNTFIDKRNFKTYEELYQYIKNMPEKEYIDYLAATKNFTESEKISPFSAECFADTLIKKIVL